MRRFLVFAGSRYHSFGGWGDYKSDHDTEDEAREGARRELRWCDWAELVDLQTGRREAVYAERNRRSPGRVPGQTAGGT